MPNNSSFDLTFWNRLESRTQYKEFDRSMKNEIRDGLWMLTRQWQTGEFQAEDTGSPVFSCMEWSHAPMKRIALAQNGPSAISPEIPLEAEVERVQLKPDICLQIEMGRHLKRLLKRHLSAERAKEVMDKLLAKEELRFVRIKGDTDAEKYNNAQLLANIPMQQYIEAAIFGKAIDGWEIFEKLKASQTLSQLIGESDAALDSIGATFYDWFVQRYNQPENIDKDGWLPQRLEYQFAVGLETDEPDKAALTAREYFQGRLDWYAMDYAQSGDPLLTEGLTMGDESSTQGQRRHMIPSELEFPGMPNARWWEFEDRRINFAALEGKLNETAKMALTEFAFLYSNDWFLMPLRVPIGSTIEIEPIVVTDVFGQRSIIKHYEESETANPHWSFFRIFHANQAQANQKDACLLLPPVLLDLQEGKPLEEVWLARDEMANMVWGIETTVPDNLGGGKNGNENAQATRKYYQTLAGTPPLVPMDNEATIQYQIATTVPENWIPFIAVRKEGTIDDIILRRGAMPRVLPGFPIRRIRPLTQLLRFGMDDNPTSFYDICEEEVPSSGAIVKLRWQRARWHDGRIALWLGYQKTNGRGERSSGLKFDQFVEKP